MTRFSTRPVSNTTRSMVAVPRLISSALAITAPFWLGARASEAYLVSRDRRMVVPRRMPSTSARASSKKSTMALRSASRSRGRAGRRLT